MAYVTREMIQEMEERYGIPQHLYVTFEITPPEFSMLRSSRKNERNHDVTIFIFKDRDYRKFAGIAKHMFPEGAYRAPSGAANPGESLEEGIRRESMEETGLEIDIERFILMIHAVFTCGPESEGWRSMIFTAFSRGGKLGHQDEVEIRETSWITLEELQGPIREKLLHTGMGLFTYRVALHDASVEVIEKLRE
jgi:8-oxo-dGTP pyrophosphatase MutT (NUDIX family)